MSDAPSDRPDDPGAEPMEDGLRAAFEGADMDRPLPESFGSYRIHGVLGEGGMGVVYDADQASPSRRVALKVIRPGQGNAQTRRRFALEAELLGRLQHPGVAQIYEAGVIDEGAGPQPFFAMERVAGEPMDAYVRAARPSLRDRVALMADVADAVHHAHQQGIIHRDLKPANVMVDDEGRPKVLDFGVARLTEKGEDGTLLTAEGQIVGTLPYMSPEQVWGKFDDVDTRTDVYSLGVMFYELLGGRLPLELSVTHLVESLSDIRDKEPPLLGRLNAQLRGDVETIAAKTLEKDKTRRYDSAAAFADDLRRYLAGKPVQARPASSVYLLRKFVGRHRVLVAAASLVVLSLAAGIVLAVQSAHKADAARVVAQSERNAKAAALLEVERERDQVLRLSDAKKVRDLLRQAEELWPIRSDVAPRMADWLDRARDVLEKRRDHEQALDEVRGRALPVTEEARTLARERAEVEARAGRRTSWTFEVEADAWRHQVLNELLANLTRLADGRIAEVQARHEAASTLWKTSVDDHQEAWTETIEAIAASEHYGGLRLAAQEGLVPFGPDPGSGLFEFAHLGSGSLPTRDRSTGKLVCADDAAIVLVLIPGGTFLMGAQGTNPEGDNFDPSALAHEKPVHPVALSPFFLAKHECTQAQWAAMTGTRPSRRAVGQRVFGHDLTDRNPVEHVSWADCDRWLPRHGLLLPTEAQWEYACRAGTDTPWFSGREDARLGEVANIADAYLKANGGPGTWSYSEDVNDGHGVHAPAGSLSPNALGLLDVHGNVREWCLDIYAAYREGPQTDPAVNEGSGTRVHRGGSWDFTAGAGRSANRVWNAPGYRSRYLGVRPARVVTP